MGKRNTNYEVHVEGMFFMNRETSMAGGVSEEKNIIQGSVLFCFSQNDELNVDIMRTAKFGKNN